jgi:hypothetical protein
LAEMRRALQPDGLLILNISNHIRSGEEQHVSEWWRSECEAQGFDIRGDHLVSTARLRQGANHQLRVPYEHVYVFRRP